MTKTSQEMRQLVEDFVKVTKVKFTDITEKAKEKSPMIEWQLHVGQALYVTKLSTREDRIQMTFALRLPPEHIGKIVTDSPSFEKIAMDINYLATVCGVFVQWIKTEKNEIRGLNLSTHLDESILTRVNFHDKWDNLARVGLQIQRIFGTARLGTTAATTNETSDKSMYT
ncbi:MAG: hypothetical protein R3327_05220 [Nitrosopumilaceae archaeon]|nr:hypothetical protein [Nitrosopumilaceae archaeon]